MLSTITSRLQKEENKVLLSNFFSLSILQMANFILPLLTVPYLLRVLGVELYGLLAFASALIAYFLILSDYGFNLTATREVSVHRDNREKIIEIFSSVMIIKATLALLGFCFLALIVFGFDKFSSDVSIYFLTFGMVIGQVLFPTWLFQGMEKMTYISILNIIAKLLFVILIFIFVRNQEDVLLVPIFNSLGFVVAGIISLFYAKKEFGITFRLQKRETLLVYLKDGWHIFLSRIAVVLYTSSNVFILGLFTNNTMVGYYSISEKVISAISSLGRIVNQVFFPHLSKIWIKDSRLYYSKFKKYLVWMIGMLMLVSIILYITAPYIVKFLSGEYIQESIILLEIMAIVIVLMPLGGLFSQSFVTQKENYLVTRITVLTMIFNMLLVFPLIEYFGVYGLAYTIVIVQIMHFMINIRYFMKLKMKANRVCVE